MPSQVMTGFGGKEAGAPEPHTRRRRHGALLCLQDEHLGRHAQVASQDSL